MLKWVHKKCVTRGVNAFYVLGIGSTLIDPLMLVASVDFYLLTSYRQIKYLVNELYIKLMHNNF